MEPARLTVEARFNLPSLLAVLGGFKVIVPFRPSSALDLTDLAELFDTPRLLFAVITEEEVCFTESVVE